MLYKVYGMISSMRASPEKAGFDQFFSENVGQKKDMAYNLKTKHVGDFSASGTSCHMILSILAKIMFLVKSGILSVYNDFQRS